MSNNDFEQAKTFFKAETGFTTRLHEVEGMIKGGQDIVIVDMRLPSDFRQGHLPSICRTDAGKKLLA